MSNTEAKKSQSETTVVSIIASLTGNVIGQSGTLFASGGALLLAFLISGGSISFLQKGFHLVSAEMDEKAVFTPLLNLAPLVYGKVALGSVCGVVLGGVLRKIGNNISSSEFILRINNLVYNK